jgi:hypothetical protein
MLRYRAAQQLLAQIPPCIRTSLVTRRSVTHPRDGGKFIITVRGPWGVAQLQQKKTARAPRTEGRAVRRGPRFAHRFPLRLHGGASERLDSPYIFVNFSALVAALSPTERRALPRAGPGDLTSPDGDIA